LAWLGDVRPAASSSSQATCCKPSSLASSAAVRPTPSRAAAGTPQRADAAPMSPGASHASLLERSAVALAHAAMAEEAAYERRAAQHQRYSPRGAGYARPQTPPDDDYASEQPYMVDTESTAARRADAHAAIAVRAAWEAAGASARFDGPAAAAELAYANAAHRHGSPRQLSSAERNFARRRAALDAQISPRMRVPFR
jgi:hypothetical protein